VKMPPLPSYDQQELDDRGLVVDCYGGFLYKGVYIAVAYESTMRMYYYIIAHRDPPVFSLKKAFRYIDMALAKLDKLGEPWD
jgi:hypothetical protein